MQIKDRSQLLLIALLAGAALTRPFISKSTPIVWWGIPSWVIFGIFNVVITVPGTKQLRMLSVAISMLVILLIQEPAIVAFPAWMVWLPLIMVFSGLARNSTPSDSVASNGARNALSAIIGAVAMGSLLYRWLVLGNLQQTAALFVGIPTLLAVFVVYAVSPQSAVGIACKAVTIGLLVSLLFLGEGFVCILMSAPLFYAVAIVIGLLFRFLQRNEGGLNSIILLLLFIPMSLEGVTDLTTIRRDETISVSKVVRSPANAVSEAIEDTPRFGRSRPLYLRAGFPIPISSWKDETVGGDHWIIRFRGGETRLNGMEPKIGDLTLQLQDARPGFIRWRAISDSSHMTHFLNWQESTVEWEAIDAQQTKVTWTLRYRRGLDPAWYFGPMERYAVRLAAGYLIDAVATP